MVFPQHVGTENWSSVAKNKGSSFPFSRCERPPIRGYCCLNTAIWHDRHALPHVRSNRLSYSAIMFIERAFSRVQKRNDSIKLLGRKRRPTLRTHSFQSSREFGQFVSKPVGHWIVRKNDS
jgi:hypothetical protein